MAHRGDPAKPASWVEATTYSVLIDHPEGKLSRETGIPRDWEDRWGPTRLADFMPDAPTPPWYSDVAFGHDAKQLKRLKLGPDYYA